MRVLDRPSELLVAYAICLTNAAHIAERYALSSDFVDIAAHNGFWAATSTITRVVSPCLITKLVSPLGVLEKITEVHLKLRNFHTLHWSLQLRFRTTSLHYAPRTPRLRRQVCSFLS